MRRLYSNSWESKSHSHISSLLGNCTVFCFGCSKCLLVIFWMSKSTRMMLWRRNSLTGIISITSCRSMRHNCKFKHKRSQLKCHCRMRRWATWSKCTGKFSWVHLFCHGTPRSIWTGYSCSWELLWTGICRHFKMAIWRSKDRRRPALGSTIE